jgi:hypothetical protein
MIRIRGPDQVRRIDDTEIRQLVEQRFAEICAGEPYDYDAHGEVFVVEPGDTAAALEEQSGCPILTGPFDDSRSDEEAVFGLAEWIEDHGGRLYEATYVLNDDGFGVSFVIPHRQGIDAQLLKACARLAVRAADSTQR